MIRKIRITLTDVDEVRRVQAALVDYGAARLCWELYRTRHLSVHRSLLSRWSRGERSLGGRMAEAIFSLLGLHELVREVDRRITDID